jgi:hypothetical protein
MGDDGRLIRGLLRCRTDPADSPTRLRVSAWRRKLRQMNAEDGRQLLAAAATNVTLDLIEALGDRTGFKFTFVVEAPRAWNEHKHELLCKRLGCAHP